MWNSLFVLHSEWIRGNFLEMIMWNRTFISHFHLCQLCRDHIRFSVGKNHECISLNFLLNLEGNAVSWNCALLYPQKKIKGDINKGSKLNSNLGTFLLLSSSDCKNFLSNSTAIKWNVRFRGWWLITPGC